MLFPGDLNVAQCEAFASGNIEGLRETKLAVSHGASSNQKIGHTVKKLLA